MGAFVMVKSPDELLSDELTCFHTKMKLKETSLGIGVSISRLPRTGEIRMLTPTLDLLSMRAFTKQKVRHSLSNEKFSHWLPLYFGEKDIFEVKRSIMVPAPPVPEEEKLDVVLVEKEGATAAQKKPLVARAKSVSKQEIITINCKERLIHLLKKSMAYISSGSTRKPFKPAMILEMLPKLIVTHVADLIQEVRHVSILAIRRLMNFIRLFRLLIDLHPEIQE